MSDSGRTMSDPDRFTGYRVKVTCEVSGRVIHKQDFMGDGRAFDLARECFTRMKKLWPHDLVELFTLHPRVVLDEQRSSLIG